MSVNNSSNSVWHVKLDPYHFIFFKKLAHDAGNKERGAAARECRKFLDEKIIEHKRSPAKVRIEREQVLLTKIAERDRRIAQLEEKVAE